MRIEATSIKKGAFGIDVSSRNPSCLSLVFLGDVLNFRPLQVSPLPFWDVILNGDILVVSAKTVPTVPAGSCVRGSHTRLGTDAARDDVVTYPGSFCSANIWLHTHLEPQLLPLKTLNQKDVPGSNVNTSS